jgi:hypothetical protein
MNHIYAESERTDVIAVTLESDWDHFHKRRDERRFNQKQERPQKEEADAKAYENESMRVGDASS